jgi:hypothetical protein
MSRMLELSDPLYAALKEAADASGTTPEGWIAAHLPNLKEQEIAPTSKTLPARTAKELLMQLAGCMTDLPSDLARNHDHYLHGTPKK